MESLIPLVPTKHRLRFNMLTITLPDQSQRQFESPLTVAEVAQSIGAGLAKAALGGKVNGKLVDTSYLINQDANLAIITDKDPEGLEIIRHSTNLTHAPELTLWTMRRLRCCQQS